MPLTRHRCNLTLRALEQVAAMDFTNMLQLFRTNKRIK